MNDTKEKLITLLDPNNKFRRSCSC